MGPDSLPYLSQAFFLPFKGPNGSLGKYPYFNPIQARGVFRYPLKISATIQASPMKLSTVIVLLKAYQNTQINFQKSDP